MQSIKRMRFSSLLAVVVLVALTLASGLLHGRLSRRWGASEQLQFAGERLSLFPTRFGSWVMQSSSELGEYAETVLETSGHINRVYRNEDSGSQVAVALVVGPAGPIATHSPEICFSSRDYRVLDERKQVSVSWQGTQTAAKFWALTFAPANEVGDLLRVYYGWSDGAAWGAPRDPRLAYFGRPLLYKLQVAASVPVDADLQASDPCARFLESFLNALQSHWSRAGQGGARPS